MSADEYDDIVVVGGGCYGSYYLTQLRRARAAGKIAYRSVIIVDHDAHCAAAALVASGDDAQLVIEDWNAFFDAYFARVTPQARDAIVPSPLMPHLMYAWLLRRAQARWPERKVVTAAAPGDAIARWNVPWRQAAPDGTQYASYATWICPINCVEPRRCPHTRSERTWTMPNGAAELVALGTRQGEEDRLPLSGPVIFHCTHRAYGVGMFDTRDVLAGDAQVAQAGARGAMNMLVGTVSHCHGAFNVLHVASPSAR